MLTYTRPVNLTALSALNLKFTKTQGLVQWEIYDVICVKFQCVPCAFANLNSKRLELSNLHNRSRMI